MGKTKAIFESSAISFGLKTRQHADDIKQHVRSLMASN